MAGPHAVSGSTSRRDEPDIWVVDLHEDERAWGAVVRVAGVTYIATYVAAHLQVRRAPSKCPSRRRASHVDTVRIWALARILGLSSDWHARHEVLHGVREQQEAIRLAVLERLKFA